MHWLNVNEGFRIAQSAAILGDQLGKQPVDNLLYQYQ